MKLRQWPRIAIANWQTFWFKPELAFPLGLARIAFGVVVTLWTLALLPNLFGLFGRNGAIPQRPSRGFTISVLDLCGNDLTLFIVWVALLLSAIAMTVGWHTRVASLLVFVIVYSFVQGYRQVFNAGDALLSIEALVFALSSSGVALSLDQRRRTGMFWTAQHRAPWATRLLQLELSLIYLVAVQTKLLGYTWINGTAVSYAWRGDLNASAFPAPAWLYNGTLLVNLATWGALFSELALAVLVWNRWCRPWVLLAGVVMHSMISLTQDVSFFGFAMFVLYCAFLPPESLQQLPGTIRGLPDRPAWRWLTAKSTVAVVHQAETEPENPSNEGGVAATVSGGMVGNPSVRLSIPSMQRARFADRAGTHRRASSHGLGSPGGC